MARNQRRLAAIVSADVAGYSRLMGLDDSGTLARLKDHRRELIDPKIAEYGGRIVKTTGDGLLLEFPSVVEAVRCAVDMQRGMAERNAGVVPDQRIEFRVGVNVGDIIIDGDDIFGDGVNVAARLQALAEPGEICVSKVVRDQVLDKLSFAFEDIGPQQVKNIARPVEVYRVDLASEALQKPSGGRRRLQRLTRDFGWRWLAVGIVAICLAGIASWTLTEFWKTPHAFAPPAMSVVVAPLTATQGDAETARFADALTRELVSGVARSEGILGRLRVVAFQGDATGEAIDPSVVGRRLNVRYLLKGNVLHSDEGNTVDLQLVDTDTAGAVWSQRATVLDSDVSAEASLRLWQLATKVRIALAGAEARRVLARPVGSLNASELVIRAVALRNKDPSINGILEARKLLSKALQVDPNLVAALIARSALADADYGLDPKADRGQLVREMDQDTARAVQLDPSSAFAWSQRGAVLRELGRWDAALEANATAIKLDPNEVAYWADKAEIMDYMGRPAEALALRDRVLATAPSTRVLFATTSGECRSHLLLGQTEQAASMCEKARAFDSDWQTQALLVATYADQGDMAKAAGAKVELLRYLPGFTVAQARAFDQPSHPEYAKLAESYYYEGLRKAGIPEK